ncbi:unnamed protein product [Cuscuta europaea]|uniref:Uncharacterized protein n=1 Tax=Cuscuta europaea TaxID=41803 RepID=A0A9P0Z7T4_CUSEU|nr:unnamed protein product [Cuscuta europaea]
MKSFVPKKLAIEHDSDDGLPPLVDFGVFCSNKGSSSTDTESISSLIFKEDLHYLGLMYESDNISRSAIVIRDTSHQGTLLTFETKEIDVSDILETTPLQVSFSPHNIEPLLADELVSPQTEVLEYINIMLRVVKILKLRLFSVQRTLSDRELLDRVADTF